jgi:hypothetical protein
VKLYRYFVSQSSEFCRHNTLCCFSTSVCCYFVIDSVRKLLDTPSYSICITCIYLHLQLFIYVLGHEADHSPPSNSEVKNAWSYTSTPPIRLLPLHVLHRVICSYSLPLRLPPKFNVPFSRSEVTFRYGGLLRMYWISSRGQPTRGCPTAWGFGQRLSSSHHKNEFVT